MEHSSRINLEENVTSGLWLYTSYQRSKVNLWIILLHYTNGKGFMTYAFFILRCFNEWPVIIYFC